ncbi:hypothetical protein M885DRAFT_527359 [Pelagophyceae sp. CCMP2097]|nr:hypothetical protein M885DRAFT_527359 [Pelagophyceae sp. CCMP2097]
MAQILKSRPVETVAFLWILALSIWFRSLGKWGPPGASLRWPFSQSCILESFSRRLAGAFKAFPRMCRGDLAPQGGLDGACGPPCLGRLWPRRAPALPDDPASMHLHKARPIGGPLRRGFLARPEEWPTPSRKSGRPIPEEWPTPSRKSGRDKRLIKNASKGPRANASGLVAVRGAGDEGASHAPGLEAAPNVADLLRHFRQTR